MFSLAMLVRLGRISEEDVHNTFKVFQRLDVDGNGVLDSYDILAGMHRKVKRQWRKKRTREWAVVPGKTKENSPSHEEFKSSFSMSNSGEQSSFSSSNLEENDTFTSEGTNDLTIYDYDVV
uniref:EF-hand domain-containing protein n=1 Tax=Corethron hystrix TaxID=216773 RepID=A0A7S1FRI7_9STRA|mmetsp:Transcript_22908/g.52489  ORF Transcript_22908/g.52489 Transcript_22908/m.52489 type:complete len:121 (+) Transcript_22908:3-365(+)